MNSTSEVEMSIQLLSVGNVFEVCWGFHGVWVVILMLLALYWTIYLVGYF